MNAVIYTECLGHGIALTAKRTTYTNTNEAKASTATPYINALVSTSSFVGATACPKTPLAINAPTMTPMI